MTEIDTVGVVGAGTMGIGGAHAFAAGGLPVVLVDISQQALDRARAEIATNARMYGLIDRELAGRDIIDLITFTTDTTLLADADFVVENVTEDWAVKRDVYAEIDRICPPHTVFGVNTSAIPITTVASATGRPDRVIGVHLMNPVPLKKVVEVVRGFRTSPSTIAATQDLLRRIGKGSVVVADSPGFVTNRVAMLSVNEAIMLVEERVGTAAEIDVLFRQCLGHQMGPLETADLIGLDTVLKSLEVLLDNFNDPKFRPAQLLRRLVAAGLLGRKTGHGFYDYEGHEMS
ncbi:3-hydroxyacyl-CoA dehydrogenase family protein [Kutzneria sp. NPDC052558]|uniref:3-hydroxyacyl-CoA dehydrogenase family protein n=1 Tax=Kutzneria sp. NPDC052558 TaxID=3364121 RepID=UPI0037C5E228